MKHWINKNYKTLIIAAFLIPIITVAIVSISHVTKWYGISNPVTWAVYLSIGIEIAALSALAAISANMGKKVYFPFMIVTLIQFIGNIFFAYSYIDINSQSFKDWVGLVSPLVEFMGVEPTDFVGHKRFLAFFAGGMLPIISLSFLHMLVKFTEEDRLKEVKEEIKDDIDPSEIARVRLSEADLKILEEALLNPPFPNEKLKEAAKKYSEEVKEKHTPIEDFDIEVKIEKPSIFPEEVEYNEEYTRPVYTNEFKEQQKDLLAEMMKNDQELGLYDEPFDNPMIKEPVVSVDSTIEPDGTFETTEELPDDNVSDWDITLMDGLEDEEIFQEEPTEEEIQGNFSTIEPNTENIFQEEYIPSLSDEEIMEMNQNEYERILDNDEFITDAINEFNQQSIEDEIEESITTPEEIVKFNIDEVVDNQPEIQPFNISIELVDDEPVYQSDNKEIDDINKIMDDAINAIAQPPIVDEIQVSNNWIEPTTEIPSEEEELKKKVQES
jgi:hypothetical protein